MGRSGGFRNPKGGGKEGRASAGGETHSGLGFQVLDVASPDEPAASLLPKGYAAIPPSSPPALSADSTLLSLLPSEANRRLCESGLCPGQRNFSGWLILTQGRRQDTSSLGQSTGTGQRPSLLALSRGAEGPALDGSPTRSAPPWSQRLPAYPEGLLQSHNDCGEVFCHLLLFQLILTTDLYFLGE